MNNKVSAVCVCVCVLHNLFSKKEGKHWYKAMLSGDSRTRGSEAR